MHPDYQFLEKIGGGSYGSVSKCLHLKKKKLYAVKEVGPKGYDQWPVESIQKEIWVLMEHKHVNRIPIFHPNFSSANIIRNTLSLFTSGFQRENLIA